LAALCNDLQLGECPSPTPSDPHLSGRALFEAWEKRHPRLEDNHFDPAEAARALARDARVDPTRTLGATTEDERRRLCAWYVGALSHWQRSLSGTTKQGWNCKTGRRSSVDLDDFAACLKTFPRCDTPVGKAQRCVHDFFTSVADVEGECNANP